MTGAFSGNIKSLDEQVNVDAPLFHVVPYVTGGFQRLLHLIKTDCVPDLPEYGYHTNSDGHFDPKGDCMIGLRYKVKKILDAKGQSAVLVLAQDEFSHRPVVIKVLHSHFYQLGGQESHVLRKLAVADPLNLSHTLRLLTTVAFDSHYCLVFDPLLPDPLTSVFSNIPSHRILSDVRRVGLRLLASVGFLHQQNFIHTDLKPDNILLKHENDLDSVHIVDFGNTINYVHSEVSLYYKDFELQTPLYRAPEVMYGVPFGPEIDIWSLGCILAELVIGKPLFLGITKEEIMEQMTSLLGPFPAKIFRRGKYYKTFRKYTSDEDQANCTLKLMEHLQCKDIQFADLIARMLIYNPEERLTVSEAARHPFFASYLPLAFLLPSNTGCSSCPAVSLTKESYSYKPYISSDIRRQPLSSLDLLRQGTTELPNLEETNVIKPSPRQGKYRDNTTEIEEPAITKAANVPPNRKALTDVSVVRNFIVDSEKRKYSENVKDKMSSLLEAIRQEQDCVEDDLERRDRAGKAGLVNENASDRAVATEQFRSEVTIPRPCPRYGRFDVNDKVVEDKTSRKINSNRGLRNTFARGVMHGKESRHTNFVEPSGSNQNFEDKQMDKMHRVQNKHLVSGKVDKELSIQSEDTAVSDGSPTAHGIRARHHGPQSTGFEKISVHEKNKMKGASELSFDGGKHSVLSGKSDINSTQRETSLVSGYAHDMSEANGQDTSESSYYDSDSDTNLSQVGTFYSGKPERRMEYSRSSDQSTKSKEMKNLRGQVLEKRQNKYCERKLSHHSGSSSNFRTYRDNPKDAEDGTSKSLQRSERGAKMTGDIFSPSLPVKKHPVGERIPKGVVSPSFGNRKRLASESISDNEEYVELLSPLVARSDKKKVKAAVSGTFVTKTHFLQDDNSPHRRKEPQKVKAAGSGTFVTKTHLLQDDNSPHRRKEPQKRTKSNIEESPETVDKMNIPGQDTGINRLDKSQLKSLSSQKEYSPHIWGTGSKVYEKEHKTLHKPSWNDDLTPSSRQKRVGRVMGGRMFIERELPAVTPIKREDKFSGMKDWMIDSPEIIYKERILGNGECVKKEREKFSGQVPRTKHVEKGVNNSRDNCLQEHSKRRSLSNKSKSNEVIHAQKFDRNRDLNTEEKSKVMRRNSFEHAEKMATVPNKMCDVPNKMGEFSFKGTPDTDPKLLALRGGYAERIAQISRKRKKARKSLAFDSRRSTTVGYMEENGQDEMNRIDIGSESNGNEILSEDFEGYQDNMKGLHTNPRNLPSKHVNPASLQRISDTQNNRRSLGEDFIENQKHTHGRRIHSDNDGAVHRQHVRKSLKSLKDVVGPKLQKDLKHVKKFDSTFTIDFESPLRDNKLNK